MGLISTESEKRCSQPWLREVDTLRGKGVMLDHDTFHEILNSALLPDRLAVAEDTVWWLGRKPTTP